MPGSWPQQELPNLTNANCSITSPATRRYNCIAWVAKEDFRNWWPDPLGIGYWPATAPRSVTTDAFIKAYGTLGFKLCYDGTLEEGLEKIALFGIGATGAEVPTHAARQLPTGEWTSKLGNFEDITHASAGDVNGPVYGQVLCYLERQRKT